MRERLEKQLRWRARELGLEVLKGTINPGRRIVASY